MSDYFDQYCPRCRRVTLWRWLFCEEHGRDCRERVCTVCGDGEEAKKEATV